MFLERIPIKDAAPELELAIDASMEAGRSILEVYGRKFRVKLKDDHSPLTEADLKSNEIITRHLSNTPYMILSEEGRDNEDRLGEKTVWIVDPLDGTADFVDRTGEFTVMIALVRDGKPVLGVINWPAEGTVFAAQYRRGAFRYSDGCWQKIAVTGVSELSKCRMVGSRHHLSEREDRFVKRLGVEKFTSIGSSLKAAKIASGEAEAYFTTTDKIKEWDTAASYCIVNEAGGRMTDMQGRDISYNNRTVNHQNGILVTNGRIHDKILREFEDFKAALFF